MRTVANASIGGLDGPSLLKLIDAGGDPGVLRPYRIPSGNPNQEDRCFIEVTNKNTKKRERHRVPYNATTLPYETWLEIDKAVQRAAQSPMRAVNDLKAAGCVRTLPNGFATAALLGQRASRIGTAELGMDPQGGPRRDRPVSETVLLPLPCIWSGFGFGARELAMSKQSGLPLDTTAAADSMEACARLAEKMLIGNSDYDQYTYAGGTIYGYTDHASRITFHITAPDASGWTPETFIAELLAGRQELIAALRPGPYILYMSPDWAQYLDNDYKSDNAGTTATITLRQRIKQLTEITDIRYLYDLSGWDILLVQMDTNTVQEVIGMEWTTVQWETMGGQSMNWMVLGIYVPQIRSDYDGHLGIGHGGTALS